MTLNEQLTTAAQMERDGFTGKDIEAHIWEVQLRQDEDAANALSADEM